MTRSEKLSNLFCEDYRVIDFLPKAVPETAGDFLVKQKVIFCVINSFRISVQK